jgi:hypothetical protein
MADRTGISTNFASRLLSVLTIGLVAAALFGLALAPGQASPRYERYRAPDPGKRPVIVPPRLNLDAPRTAIDAARDARLAQEAANARAAKKWAKRLEDMGEGLPKRDKKTGKFGFKGSDQTFHSRDSAREAWGVMVNVYDLLSGGDVKGAKEIWKKAKKEAENVWYGRQRGERIRDIRYGDGADAAAHGNADEKAQNEVLDGLWHDIKGAEASGLQPVKASAPAPTN